ncbi:hypothetical protein CROQUDRAFT_672050 [Cronartium quercuum f. sp. fusiforme G11]|uniref:Uncharacterized protein n=1 Tax=Cronartium quercuum f. sp. fusiforme G11 TaxID=708437 RepID=A0A9P6TA99_9BASI|nr:hypothetical protein CROQUDRAFT_672050 [Cronartium quercuum f. sp. fusiforme G11]
MATPSTGGTKFSDKPPSPLPSGQKRALEKQDGVIGGRSVEASNPIKKTSAWKSFVSGGFGGVCAVLVGQPFDLTKTRLQTAQPGQYTGAIDVVRKTIARDGFTGFYRGMSSPLIGVTPMFAVSFWGYAMGKKLVYSFTPQRVTPDLSYSEYAIAGAFSALPTTLIAAPVERIKVLLQVDGQSATQRYAGPVDCIRQVYREGGIRSIFRGSLATVARDAPGSAAYFVAYEAAKRALTPKGAEPGQIKLTTVCAAGGLAGVAMWSIAIPPDVIKSRLQAAPTGTYKGFVDCARQTVASDGVGALFKGFGPAMMRAVPANAATFLGVELALLGLNKIA